MRSPVVDEDFARGEYELQPPVSLSLREAVFFPGDSSSSGDVSDHLLTPPPQHVKFETHAATRQFHRRAPPRDLALEEDQEVSLVASSPHKEEVNEEVQVRGRFPR